jgi:cysteine desulfurase/selenocysteine lyase
MELNIEKIRNDFPILKEKIYKHPLVYLDNAATNQKPKVVLDAIDYVYTKKNANVHRGVHYLSQEATLLHEYARKKVQTFINASSVEEIIFTKGTTDSLNLLAATYSATYLKKGDEIILSVMEHHSNIVPWQLEQTRKGIKVKVIPMNEKGELLLDEYQKLFTSRTKLVSVVHVSNVLGTVNPIKKMAKIAHAHNVPIAVDGAQAVAHMPVDVQVLDVDFYSFSGHKLYAPTGIGVFYGKKIYLEQLIPYQGGGEMIKTVSFEKTIFNELPFKFEAGTPNYVGSYALAKAIEYLEAISWETIQKYEHDLTSYAQDRLSTIEGIHFYGEASYKDAVISFLVKNIHHFDMGTLLDHLGIAVRTGHHCAQPLMHSLGIEGTLRASFAIYNTYEEIDLFVDAVERVSKMF